VAAVDIIFNKEQPHAVQESASSFNVDFTLNATTSHDVDITITVQDITAKGIVL